jgi:hypothetical protein
MAVGESADAALHEQARALVHMGGSANLAAALALYDGFIERRMAALGPFHPADCRCAA